MRGFSASSLEDSWQLTPLTMSCSSSSSRHKNCSALQGDYSSYLQLQSFGDSPKQLKQEEHYYEMQNKMGREEPQKIMHHFFDEWSPKDRESWLDLDDKSSNTGSVSATRLSMSISNNSLQHDFSSIFNSNKHNENWIGVLRSWFLHLAFALYLGSMTQVLPKCITNKLVCLILVYLTTPHPGGVCDLWVMSKNVLKREKWNATVCMRWDWEGKWICLHVCVKTEENRNSELRGWVPSIKKDPKCVLNAVWVWPSASLYK